MRMRTALALIALVLATLVLHLVGIGHSVPHSKEADANMALHVELIRSGVKTPDPHHNDAQYPIILPGLISLVPDTTPHPGPQAPLEEHLAAAGHVYTELRIVMALLSALSIPLVYLLARRFLSSGWSLVAAALFAASFLTQFFAQQARPHTGASTVFLLSVLTSMRFARDPSWKTGLAACAMVALSIGTLQSGLAMLLPLATAWLFSALRTVHRSSRSLSWQLWGTPLLLVGLVVLSFAVFYPYLYYEGQESSYGSPRIDGTKIFWGDHRIDLHDWKGAGFATILRTLAYYEPGLLVLLGLALAALLVRKLDIYRPWERWSDFWVAASFVVPYVIVTGLFRNTFERFLIPLIPYFAVLGAWALAFWSERSGRVGKLATAAVAALAIAVPAVASARLAQLRAQDDTLERATKWLAAQPDALATPIYVTPFFDLPLVRSATSLRPPDKRPAVVISRWSIWQKRVGVENLPEPRFDLRYLVPRPDLGFGGPKMEADPEGYVAALGPGFFVLDMSRQPARPGLDRLRAEIRRRAGECVFRSAPESEGAAREFGFPFEDELLEDWPNVIARVPRIDAVGQVIEIYRVR
jgi:hypothetical protein